MLLTPRRQKHLLVVLVVSQGMLVMIPLLPFSLAKHTYGPDAAEFRPQRWMHAGQQQEGHALPDPLTFLVGPRDW